MSYQVLTEAQVQHFIENGYVIIKDCFPRETAREWVDLAYKRLGYDPNDPTTWEKPIVHLPAYQQVVIKDFAPKAWGAMCDLLGGEDRIKDADQQRWGDGFIANFKLGADRPWQPPSAETDGWHVDGDWFWHFLDSGEQGLLNVVIWQDIGPKGGGTFIAPDSIKPVAELLRDHPEGLDPYSPLWGEIKYKCTRFLEVTGETGDVAMLHPLMLHASSQNVSGIPRFMTNPCLSLKDPMNLNRDNPAAFSPVERAILNALGVERLDFQPTTPRRLVEPKRVQEQKKMLEEQKARLAQQS